MWEGKSVTHKGHFPDQPHWAIICFEPAKAPSGAADTSLQSYTAYFTEATWKKQITALTLAKKKFVAFKSSAAAKVTPNYSVNVDIKL